LHHPTPVASWIAVKADEFAFGITMGEWQKFWVIIVIIIIITVIIIVTNAVTT